MDACDVVLYFLLSLPLSYSRPFVAFIDLLFLSHVKFFFSAFTFFLFSLSFLDSFDVAMAKHECVWFVPGTRAAHSKQTKTEI